MLKPNDYGRMEVTVMVLRQSFLGEDTLAQLVEPGERVIINVDRGEDGQPILGPNVRLWTDADEGRSATAPAAAMPGMVMPPTPDGLPPGSVWAGAFWLSPTGDGNYKQYVPAQETDPILLAAAGLDPGGQAGMEARSAQEGQPLKTNRELRADILAAGGPVMPANATSEALRAELLKAQTAKV